MGSELADFLKSEDKCERVQVDLGLLRGEFFFSSDQKEALRVNSLSHLCGYVGDIANLCGQFYIFGGHFDDVPWEAEGSFVFLEEKS